ncbi:hypothetical protein A2Y85_01370 [candidate division WOR-3 bacterium RBG_13_43_14]|uniref:Peptidase S8/S53 domain-containing protein n=1 Tax=candidate division WOR-3 bacterium RBG_13_43_14 TaxID=1802590 RepID=A0A1F4U6D4_UNCW3|nr:MAG: hypothetical protein A2Y85_01370 [candidate division WOR-3 bacterium RBG_13_43_14]
MNNIKIVLLSLFLGVTVLNAGYITSPLQAVLDTLSSGNKTWVSVHLVEKPNLTRFPQKAYAQKIAHLKEFSQRVQRPLIDFANSFGNQIDSLKSFWVFNGFTLKATKPVILAIVSRPEVDFVNGGETRVLEGPIGGGAPPPPEREWNIERVGAHLVWLDGYTGEEIVVCIFDSGMREDHESYVEKWRTEYGWLNAWKDASNQQQTTPVDYNGHGTHVGGIAIGGDGWSGSLRDIGVAPGAKLIACTPRYAYSALRHACFQWIADLTNTPYGNLAPDVVNCSWGDQNHLGDSDEYWFDIIVLRELGIIPVFCIGNNNQGWMDLNWPPGNFPTTIGVGATNYYDQKASFSCEGPAPTGSPWCESKYWSRPDWNYIKPDIIAPGGKYEDNIGIYSADKNDPNNYLWMQGTSQATPHITGAIALMQEAAMVNFGHKLDYSDIYDILIESAEAVGQTVPNNQYGWGRLNCKHAVDSVVAFQMKSSSPLAMTHNNQHKLLYDEINGKLHFIYQSGQDFTGHGKYIRHTNSTDGEHWSVEQKLGDGDTPTIALDDNGNVHCIYRDGNAILYQRLTGAPETLFIDLFAMDVSVPAFAIYENTGYVAFELYNQWMQSFMRVGSFDITSVNPVLQYSDLESTSAYRFGAPALVVDPDYGLVVVYTRKINGIPEVYYRASEQGWQLMLVSNNDGVKSCSPAVISALGLWFFWEEAEPSDIYYRRRTINWLNRPSPVYTSSEAASIAPRVALNNLDPSKLYVSWSEQTGETYNIYVSAYYGSWQNPSVISTSVVESRDPDLVYIPEALIEGRLLVNYAEGNEEWINRGTYLPVYRLHTYQSVLPFTPGGGAQSKDDSVINTGDALMFMSGTVVNNHIDFRYVLSSAGIVRLLIYDTAGRVVKTVVNAYPSPGDYQQRVDVSKLPAGVYFVGFKTSNDQKIEKVVLIK